MPTSIGNYKVEYSTNGSTWTFLDNVQEISINLGRQRQLDTYNASTATVSLRYPTGYASPITALVSGTYIRIKSPNLQGAGSGNAAAFLGKIRDVTVDWGKIYQSGVGPADYASLSCEGFFAAFARMAGDGYSMASAAPQDQLDAAELETGLVGNYYRPSGTDPVMAATTVSGTWGDWLNSIATTINGRLWDANLIDEVDLISPFYQNPSAGSPELFSDVPNAGFYYDRIDFSSYADNFWDQVTVTPVTASPATSTASGATAPFRTLSLSTLNSTTAQATDYADYLLGLYSSPQFRITSISCLYEAQWDNQLDALSSQTPPSYMGMRIQVAFRGTTYQAIIEGVSITATTESSRYTFFVSSADQNNYLILDNTQFGQLDYNRLGY